MIIPKLLHRQIVFFAWMTCSWLLKAQTQLPLMPYPQFLELKEGKYYLDKDLSLSVEGNYSERLPNGATWFLRQMIEQAGLFIEQHKSRGELKNASIVVSAERPGKLEIGEDESYKLQIAKDGVKLSAVSDIGAIHGLMTLLQLIQADETGYYLPYVQIEDAPRFPWRGMMLDPSRHFLPLETLRRNIDAMAAVKLNVLHLHLSDDQGFRFQSELFPELTQKASDGDFYTKQELKELISYASQKGIMIMPEIDVPGHATAILTAFPELGSKDTTYVLERFAGIFDPTLNPTNDEVYVFLDKLFGEVASVFPSPYFHIGGDENMGKHWDENVSIQRFMKKHHFKTNHELQGYMNLKLQKILAKYDKQVVGWEEIMTDDLGKNAIVHSWKGVWEDKVPKQSLYEAASRGYKTILSNGYYLDLMLSAASSYQMDPAPVADGLTDAQLQNILGGEMCMWSELVVPQTIDSRLWPRAAAIAERFWSPEEIKDVDDMYERLDVMSLWLETFGLKHIAEPNRILRKLAAGHNPEPLRILLDQVEPMKGYTRNPGGTMFSTFSPYTKWVDAAIVDAPGAKMFNEMVLSYANGEIESDEMKQLLELWKANHARVETIIEDSPTLEEIRELSANSSKVSSLALATINYLEAGGKPNQEWFKNANTLLEEASEQGGRTELQILDGVSQLISKLEEGK